VALVLVAGLLLTLSAVILSQINTVLLTTLSYADQSQRAIAELFGFMGEDVEAPFSPRCGRSTYPAYLRTIAGQAGSLLAATVLVILFVGFLFVERLWFPLKLEALQATPKRPRGCRRSSARSSTG
jgi:AI-2 transport protein TqsA